MGKAELLYIALAIIVFGMFSVTALDRQLSARMSIIENQIKLSAFSEAEAAVNYAWGLHFDENTTGGNYLELDEESSLTANTGFGAETGDGEDLYDRETFDDIDDFHPGTGYFKTFDTTTITIKNEDGVNEEFYSYVLKTRVDYMDVDENITTNKQFRKQLTVLIEIVQPNLHTTYESFPHASGPLDVDWDVYNQKIFTYTGRNYHNLE